MLRRAFDASVAGSTSSNGDDKRRARRTTAERANNANTANDTAAAINANATSANHCKASDANANYTIVVTAVFTATTIAGPHYNRAPTVHYAFRHNTSAGNARRRLFHYRQRNPALYPRHHPIHQRSRRFRATKRYSWLLGKHQLFSKHSLTSASQRKM
jgi:hypothetical protein